MSHKNFSFYIFCLDRIIWWKKYSFSSLLLTYKLFPEQWAHKGRILLALYYFILLLIKFHLINNDMDIKSKMISYQWHSSSCRSMRFQMLGRQFYHNFKSNNECILTKHIVRKQYKHDVYRLFTMQRSRHTNLRALLFVNISATKC